MNRKLEIKICDSFFSRFMGFMFQEKVDKILCFPRCNSIHTFFMRVSIDVIMTDKNGNILYIYRSVKPWRIILPKKDVYYIYEAPCFYFHYEVGDRFIFDKEKTSF